MRKNNTIYELGTDKYYGTHVPFTIRGDESSVTVWVMGDYEPSERQLAQWECASWEHARECDMTCDSHYESAAGYEIAKVIHAALVKAGYSTAERPKRKKPTQGAAP
jgi:hypothetical protein